VNAKMGRETGGPVNKSLKGKLTLIEENNPDLSRKENLMRRVDDRPRGESYE